jgi:hypothetical protein
MNVEVNPNEDTEWNDILRAHGVIPEKPPSPTAQLEEALEEAIQKAHDNRLEDKTLDELDELDEDGLEDEAFIAMYKQKRMAEIKEMASREKFGSVYYISKPEYTKEITDASKGNVFVFVHISYPGVQTCKLLTGLYNRLAPKYKELKFVQIDARQINDRYPHENCPTILIYKNGDVVKQVVTLSTIGGNSTGIKDMENLIISVGAVPHSDRRLIINNDGDAEYEERKTYSDSDNDYD